MSYVNFTAFEKYNLNYTDFLLLAGINQKEVGYLRGVLGESDYERFNDLNLIKHIKAKKKDEDRLISLRLSEKGTQLLEELSSAPILEEDNLIFDWISKYYKEAGKEIGNRRKTLDHIKEFRVRSGIQKNNLIKLCIDFLKDNEERSNKLQYVFYFPRTIFATRFDLEESWLYNHYLKKEEYFKSIFEEY